MVHARERVVCARARARVRVSVGVSVSVSVSVRVCVCVSVCAPAVFVITNSVPVGFKRVFGNIVYCCLRFIWICRDKFASHVRHKVHVGIEHSMQRKGVVTHLTNVFDDCSISLTFKNCGKR